MSKEERLEKMNRDKFFSERNRAIYSKHKSVVKLSQHELYELENDMEKGHFLAE